MDAVEAALARLDDGSFDRCDQCGGSIGTERLVADPLLTRCPAHTMAPVPIDAGGDSGDSEGTVAVLAHDQAFPLGAQQVQSSGN